MGFPRAVPLARVMLALLSIGGWAVVGRAEVPEAPVGIPHRVMDVILPAPQCEAARWDDARQPIVLRVLQVVPHGDAFRYQLEFHGLDPGNYDLSQWLQSVGGGRHPSLPQIPVRVVSQLPPGQIQPHALDAGRLPRMGGYRVALAGVASLWAMAGIGWWLAGRRQRVASTAAEMAVVTLADRLRPLLHAARDGRLAVPDQAELERLLLGYWCRRVSVETSDARVGMLTLRDHPQAGPLVRQLEAWLHAPAPRDAVDLEQLLAPYRDAMFAEHEIEPQDTARSEAAST